MSKTNKISVKALNQAMKRSNQRAIRTNKALGLDTVYVKGGDVIREDANGKTQSIKKLKKPDSRKYSFDEPLKID